MTELISLLLQLLTIESKTYHEQAFTASIKERLQQKQPQIQIDEYKDSLICRLPWQENKPHLALVGHSDTVPAYFPPYQNDGHLHGSGASDMKGALAVFQFLLENHELEMLTQRYNLSYILYSREEGTPLHENGLYDLIQHDPDYFRTIDLAIVGEPTDNTIQIGCVGSLHLKITIHGLACHSARPWNGVNALYQALPFIQGMSELQPIKHSVFGVDFFDVVQLTESQSEPGRTTIPGKWWCNLNFRYAPVHSPEAALQDMYDLLSRYDISPQDIDVIDNVPAGRVIETPLFQQVVANLDKPIQAKQAWTDVAQLTALGIPAFNYGPGLTAQAHKDNEYLLLSDLEVYTHSLKQLFTQK